MLWQVRILVEDGKNMDTYVHHQIDLQAMPLCTAWFDCPRQGGERGQKSKQWFLCSIIYISYMFVYLFTLIDRLFCSIGLFLYISKRKAVLLIISIFILLCQKHEQFIFHSKVKQTLCRPAKYFFKGWLIVSMSGLCRFFFQLKRVIFLEICF